MNLKLTLIALLAVGLALVSASTAERAAGAIPVEAEDAEMVALDAEADEALKLVGTGRSAAVVEAGESFDALDAEMGVADLSLDSNTDLSMPVDADSAEEHVGEDEALDADEDVAFVAESESVSIAVADDAEAQEESVSAAVDSDENASFLQLFEEDSDESEDEEEAEDEDEADDEAEDEEEDEDSDEAEGEDEEAVQTALIEQIVEADVDAEADAEAVAMTDAGVELVADAETAVRVAANVDTGVVTAEEDVASEASHAVDMVDVSDFDVAKLAAKDQEVVRTAGGVTAGLADATIEESGVAADAAPYDADVVAVVSDKVARAAAGAAAMVEVGAATATAAEAEAEMAAPFTPPTAEQQAEEQQHLDLMHSVLIQLRKEQGRPLNDEMTPADMDAIEEKMATLSLVEVSAAADTQTQAAATATADADAAHPRDHTVLVTAVVPEVQDTTPGAKLSPATIITPPQPVKPPKSPYRWDVQYRADKRQFLPHDGVELVENAHPLHRRDPTAASKLRNPVKPGVWDRRPWETTPKQQYRYDVTYEKRSACCRRREACCIRGVDTKTVVAKVKKPVRIVDPSKPEPQPQPKKADDKKKAKKADKKKAKMVKPKRAFRYDVQYEAERSKCCAAKSVCCAPPQAMYRADVQYAAGGDADAWVVVSPSGERGVVVEVDADELQMLSRIQQRQALLHKLLLTHDSPYYYDDHFDGIAMVPADAAHIVQFHEPRAASDPQQLTAAEQAELNAWMAQLPVVPHLSVVETSAAAHAAQGAVFLQTEAEADAEAVAEEAAARRLIPARVLKGFVDVQQKPENLASLLSALPPMPAAAEEQVDEMEEAMAAAEADAENDDL